MDFENSLAFPASRRTFLKHISTGAGLLLTGGELLGEEPSTEASAIERAPYRGPNVIIVRFGGGARRRETIDPQYTYAPFLCREFARRGTLFPQMQIDSFTPLVGVDTSHGQG